jgi:hypothetical protein
MTVLSIGFLLGDCSITIAVSGMFGFIDGDSTPM